VLIGSSPEPSIQQDVAEGQEASRLEIEAQIVIEEWRRHYNRVRPHSSLGVKPPVPEVAAWPVSPAVESAPPAIASRSTLN
jgi:Integrase core domain